jgi:PAS domain S-box-containing protein
MVLLAWLLSVVAAQSQKPTTANLPTLTHVEQIRGMTIEEAGRGYPVRIRGVVTYYNWDVADLFIQDSTAGIWVNPGQTKVALHHGEFVQVEGFSGVGELAPVIEHAHFRSLGEAPMPYPRRPTSDELASGKQDSQWIELQGVVRSVAEREGGLVLNLSSGAFECSVFVLKYPSLPTDIVDGQVRVRGVFGGLYDPSSVQFIGFHVLTPSWADVKLLERPTQRLWSAPVRPIRLLLRLTPEGAFTHRVHVRGVVTFQQLGRSLCIRDSEEGLLVNTTQPTPVKVGDLIDATGYPAMGDYTVIMRDAIFQRVGGGPAPEPVAVSPEKLRAGSHDADLVCLSARLLNCTTRPGEELLELQAGGVTFRAVLNTRTSSSPIGSLRAGSLLQLTGVMIVEADKNHQAKGFELLLRSPADVVVLELPSWWTARRVSWLLIILAGIVLWISCWVAVLRRRVEERTETIRATLESTLDGILVVNSVGKIVAYNRKFAEMWRIPESVLASRDDNVALSFVLSQLKDPDAFLTRVRQTYADHDAQTDDVIEFKDGRVFERHSEPQRLMGRNVGRVWGFRNVTERKRAEDALRESEQFNREVIANAQEGVTVFDREFRYQVWNRFMEGLTGVPASEALGKLAFDLFPHLREQKVDLLIRRALAGEVVHGPDTPFRVPTTGKSGWVSSVYSPHFGASGQIHGVIATIRDITERKRAEELVQEGRKELQTIIDSVPALVFYKDKANRLVRVNRTFSEAMGMPKKEMENRTCSELWPETGEGYWSDDREVIESRCPKRNIIETIKTAQGTRWLQTDKIPHLDEGGNVVGIIGFAVDITDRKRAEAALIEERHLLHTLMDNLPDVIYFKDRESRFTRINKALAKAFGLKDPAQAVGKTDFDFFTDEHSQQAFADEREIIRTGQPMLAKEEKETWPDGRETWASTTKMPLRDAHGNILGTFGVSRDITERRRAERVLEERTAYLNTLIEISPLGIITLDAQCRVQMCNPAFEQLFLYRRAEIEGANLDELLPPPESVSEALELTAESLSGIAVHTTSRRRRKDGTLIDVEIHGVPLVMHGELVGQLGLYCDITERKRAEEAIRASEQRYRLLFERNLAGVCRATLDGRFLDCNDAYARILGYQSREEMLAQPVLSVYFDPAEREAYWAKLRERGTLSNYELRLRRKDGSEVWLLANDTLLDEEADGQLVKEATVIDITERKRAEEALREANRALTAISAVNEAVLHKTEEPLLLQEVCRCIVQHAGYRMAWVGFLNDGEPKRIYPVAEAGFEQGYLHPIDVRCDDSERGRGPAGTAARTRKPAIVRNTATDAGFALWRAEATARGYASVIGLPLLTGENLLGVLTIYSAQPDAFDQQEVHLLCELAGDLAFGIQVLRTRAEQARAEEALIEERHLLHTLMDNLPDLIYFKDRESHFTRINKAHAKAFGLKDPAQAVGKADFDFFTDEHAQQAYADEQEIIRTGQPVLSKEEKETWPDGRETWASTTKMPLRDAIGDIIGTFGISRDVTERKRAEEALRESEEHFRRFIENVPLGVCRTTPDGRVLVANPALVRMLGYDSWQELASRNLEVEALEAGYPRSAFREQIEREGEVGGLEAAWKRRDGSVMFVRESARAFRADDGRVLYYDCIVEDVTERRRLGEQLRQSQKMEAVGCLAGGVAHDFNNLLTVVIGYSDLLLKRPPATCAGMRPPVEEIKKAAERAASLTRQLLAFSRKQMLQPQILDLNSLLTDVDEMLRRMIGEDIELATHLPSGLGRVKADPGQIEQVIMNLAVNARDAMPQGGQLTLEAANVELDSSHASSHESVLPGHYVMIAMSDTGIGMDAETQAHIFEPFFTTKEVGKGTGLGLATVYGIVKQSGGSIRVYSEPGKGTTFKVYLPRIDEAVEVIAPTNMPVDELSRGCETILLAEDEEAVRSLVRGVLESTGYQVLETKGANDALEVGERHRKHIHLLLTDVVMPQMSGAELVKHLAPLHPETKVLYMSGYTDHAVVRHGLLNSSTAFLQKPFTPDALALKVREVLDGAARQGT